MCIPHLAPLLLTEPCDALRENTQLLVGVILFHA
jgi:hypothetical protein